MNAVLSKSTLRILLPLAAASLALLVAADRAAAQSGAPASGGTGFEIDVVCPARVTPGEPIPLRVRVRNRECDRLDVRLLASLVGNGFDAGGGGPSGEVLISGPKRVTTLSVPAAPLSNFGTCFPTSVGETSFLVHSPVVLPDAMRRVQARQFVFADVPGTTFRDEDVCTVPEPSVGASGVAALLVLTLLRRGRRAAITLCSEEKS